MDENLKEIFDYYCKNGEKPGQTELVSMLREIQEVCGGVITAGAMQSVYDKTGLKESFINALIRYIPDIRTEKMIHRLQICSGVNCKSNHSGELYEYIKKTYKINPGEACEKYGFTYEACGCLKHCAHGPNIKWDGKVYTKVTKEMLDRLIRKK